MLFSNERPKGSGYIQQCGVDTYNSVEEIGGVEGADTMIKIYCMRKDSNFNKRKNITCCEGMGKLIQIPTPR